MRPRPKVLFFDVNETLLDLTAMKESVALSLGGRDDLLALWFTTLLHYSLVETAAGQYHNFDVIGAAALRMIGRNYGILLSEGEARAAIAPMRTLAAARRCGAGARKPARCRLSHGDADQFLEGHGARRRSAMRGCRNSSSIS